MPAIAAAITGSHISASRRDCPARTGHAQPDDARDLARYRAKRVARIDDAAAVGENHVVIERTVIRGDDHGVEAAERPWIELNRFERVRTVPGLCGQERD